MEKKVTVVLYDRTEEFNTQINMNDNSLTVAEEKAILSPSSTESSVFKKPIVAELGYAVKKYRFGLALVGLVFMLIFKNNDSNARTLNHENLRSARINTEKTATMPVVEKSFTKADNKKAKGSAQGKAEKTYHIPTIPDVKYSKKLSELKKSGDLKQLVDSYLSKYAKVALEEQSKFNIPASIILGLAVLNTEYGTAAANLDLNNHFSILCGENTIPMGKGMTGQELNNGKCYTEYESAWTSFRSNSKLIVKILKKHGPKGDESHFSVIKALEKAAYFDARSFNSTDLLEVIEDFELTKFDK